MAGLTVLTDDQVRLTLRTLSRDDILEVQKALAEALHQYSTGAQDQGACAANQPLRTSITKNDATTLFMPASTGEMTGTKMVTIGGAGGSNSSTHSSVSRPKSPAGAMSTLSLQSTSSTGTSTSNRSGSAAPSSSSQSSFPSGPPSHSASTAGQPSSTTPRGVLTVLASSGQPLGFLAAEELTAFRTALAAMMIFRKREHVSTITVFGAGKQAYWHIRLALLIRGPEIKRVNIINRTFARTEPLMKEFYGANADRLPDDWRPPASTKFSVLSKEYGEYDRLLKESVRKADVILCCTPSLEPLFPAEHLTSHEGRRKGRYVSAVGSYKPHMCELHPDILRQAVQTPHHGHHFHKHAPTSGVVVVDSLSAALKEAGEIIQANVNPAQLVELGELLMLKHQALREKATSPASPPTSSNLEEWVAKGNVIYKSVGMGLMDLVIGGQLVKLAAMRGIGTFIPGFE